MTDPATAHAAQPGDAHAVEHHGSIWPFWIAMGTGLLYLGILFPKQVLPFGILLTGYALAMWIREDLLAFRRVAAHPSAHGHGMPGPLLGMILFIGTEVLIFGSLFAVWFVGKYQAANPLPGGVDLNWPPEGVHLPIVATAINTAVLVSSGATLHLGMLQLRKGNTRGYLWFLGLTILLGALFLGQQVREYIALFQEGLVINDPEMSKLYGSAFFMLTGTHGAHVAGGLVFLAVVLFRSLRKTQTKDRHLALETAAIYWHFVDVVWIFLFVVVYLQWL